LKRDHQHLVAWLTQDAHPTTATDPHAKLVFMALFMFECGITKLLSIEPTRALPSDSGRLRAFRTLFGDRNGQIDPTTLVGAKKAVCHMFERMFGKCRPLDYARDWKGSHNVLPLLRRSRTNKARSVDGFNMAVARHALDIAKYQYGTHDVLDGQGQVRKEWTLDKILRCHGSTDPAQFCIRHTHMLEIAHAAAAIAHAAAAKIAHAAAAKIAHAAAAKIVHALRARCRYIRGSRKLSRHSKDLTCMRQLAECGYCGSALCDAFQVDHLNEWCTDDREENLVATCGTCHARKTRHVYLGRDWEHMHCALQGHLARFRERWRGGSGWTSLPAWLQKRLTFHDAHLYATRA
jgi:hypothetical protein